MLKKIGYYGLAGFLLTLPFFSFPFKNLELQFRLPKIVACYLLGVVFMSSWVWKKTHWSLGICNLIFGFSVVYSGFGPAELYPWVYWSAIMFSAIYICEHEEILDLFFWTIPWAGTLSAAYTYLQITGHDPILRYAPGINDMLPTSFFGQQTLFGAFMAATIAVSLVRGRWILAAVQIFPAFYANSSFTMAAVSAGMIIALRPSSYQIRQWMVYGCTIIVAAVIYGCYYNDHVINRDYEIFNNNGRYQVWKEATAYTTAVSPIWGSGPGSFEQIYPVKLDKQDKLLPLFHIQSMSSYEGHGAFIQAHNELVQVYFEWGWVGLWACLMVICTVGFQWGHRWIMHHQFSENELSALAVFVAILVNSMGNFPLQLAPINLIFAVSACFLLSRLKCSILESNGCLGHLYTSSTR